MDFSKNDEMTLEIDDFKECLKNLENETSRLQKLLNHSHQFTKDVKKWYDECIGSKSTLDTRKKELVAQINEYKSALSGFEDSIKKAEMSHERVKKSIKESREAYECSEKYYCQKMFDKHEQYRKVLVKVENSFRSFSMAKEASDLISAQSESAENRERAENIQKRKAALTKLDFKKRRPEDQSSRGSNMDVNETFSINSTPATEYVHSWLDTTKQQDQLTDLQVPPKSSITISPKNLNLGPKFNKYSVSDSNEMDLSSKQSAKVVEKTGFGTENSNFFEMDIFNFKKPASKFEDDSMGMFANFASFKNQTSENLPLNLF